MDRIAPYYKWLSQGFFLDQIGHRNSLITEARGRYSWTNERLDRLQDSYWTDATLTS